ncbi:MAG TPA: MXAN_5187 C-terminal domain-containing protein [Terriglobia bacterium]|nr:MXAN_5187 C-terminal domain-containing protein [Terriglobia bacterium]
MTVEEELTRLDENIRRLQIEYEAYFNGGTAQPPNDTLYRVEQAIKKYSGDASKLNVSQRFRFTQLSQRYAVHSDLWRKRMRIREEGRDFAVRRRAPESALPLETQVVCRDPDREQEKVDQLLQALLEAKQRAGERTDDIDPTTFKQFVREKTMQLKRELGCGSVRFVVTVKEGRVRFTAVKADD